MAETVSKPIRNSALKDRVYLYLKNLLFRWYSESLRPIRGGVFLLL
jgi:hypothetical protein